MVLSEFHAEPEVFPGVDRMPKDLEGAVKIHTVAPNSAEFISSDEFDVQKTGRGYVLR